MGTGRGFTCPMGLGCWIKSIEEGKRALKAAEEFGDNSLVSFAAMILTIPYSQKGNLDQGIEYGVMAIEKAPTPADKAWAEPALAFAYCREGKFEKVIEILEAVLPVYRAMRNAPEEVGYGIVLGEAYFLAGEYEKALQILKRCIELAERYKIKCYTPYAFRIFGRVALKTDPAKALQYFEKSISNSHIRPIGKLSQCIKAVYINQSLCFFLSSNRLPIARYFDHFYRCNDFR